MISVGVPDKNKIITKQELAFLFVFMKTIHTLHFHVVKDKFITFLSTEYRIRKALIGLRRFNGKRNGKRSEYYSVLPLVAMPKVNKEHFLDK